MKALQLIHLLLRSNLQFDVSSVEVKAMLQFFGKLQNQNLLIFDLYGWIIYFKNWPGGTERDRNCRTTCRKWATLSSPKLAQNFRTKLLLLKARCRWNFRNGWNLDSRKYEENDIWFGHDETTNSIDCKFVSWGKWEKILNKHSHLMTASSSISWDSTSWLWSSPGFAWQCWICHDMFVAGSAKNKNWESLQLRLFLMLNSIFFLQL